MKDNLGFVAGVIGALLLWFSATVLVTGNPDEARHEIEADGELQPTTASDIVDLLNNGKREP